MAVFVESGYPISKIRSWVSTLKGDTVLLLPHPPADINLSTEERLIHDLARARGLEVLFRAVCCDRPKTTPPLYKEAQAVVSLRDGRSKPLAGEVYAATRGIPWAVCPARIWA